MAEQKVVTTIPEQFPEPLETLITIAPMMDRTDRHFRYLARLLAPGVRLYTEMVVAQALSHGDKPQHLDFDPAEHPLALQLGGSEPELLAAAARDGEQWGYDEINLNIGCPSDRVQSGSFGACLMAEPATVARAVEAIQQNTSVPVSVKTRIGIDDHDDYSFLRGFIEEVAATGCRFFIVHARKAILAGLSPKENRSIPPLIYERVYRLKQDFPELRILINGGIRETAEVSEHLQHVDGVMIGRQAYSDPCWLAELQASFIDTDCNPVVNRSKIISDMAAYAEIQLQQGVRLSHITRHMLGLLNGERGGRHWRRFLSEATRSPDAGPEVLFESLKYLQTD